MQKKKVLFIDDDRDILSIVPIILEGEDIEVITSADHGIIAQLSDIRPNLILLDERLGERSGSSICAEIKQIEALSHIPVVLISAVINLDKIAAECDADAFIEKPFDIDHLVAVVKFLL